MKKKFLLTVVLLISFAVGVVAAFPTSCVTVLHQFVLPSGERVSLTSEQFLMHEMAVSFTAGKSLYFLEERGKKIYSVSKQGSLRTIALEENTGAHGYAPNASLSVSNVGSQLWCSKGNFICAYSAKGKFLQKWKMPEFDLGYLQALSQQRVIMDGGGPSFTYQVGKTKPVASKPWTTHSTRYFIDWNGTQWGIQTEGGDTYLIASQNIPNYKKGNAEDIAFKFQSSTDLGAAWLFWRTDSTNFYARQKVFQQADYNCVFYRIDQQGAHEIIRLKEKNDPLLAPIGPNITINRPLWGQGNSVVVYAYEAQDKNNPRPQKQYILQFSRVPRWKSWFSS